MSYMTLPVEIENGKVLVQEPEKLPSSGRGFLTILEPEFSKANGEKLAKRVQLPLIQGDASHKVNPTPAELDASLWD